MYKFLRILVIAAICGTAQSAHAKWSVPDQLTDQLQIETLKNVRNLFFATQEKVLICLNSGRTDKQCFCRYETDYTVLNQLADRMFKAYPKWQNALELRYMDGETLKSIMPMELRRQIKFNKNCISFRLL